MSAPLPDFFIKRNNDGVLPLESALFGGALGPRLILGLKKARFVFELSDELALFVSPKIMLAEFNAGEERNTLSIATASGLLLFNCGACGIKLVVVMRSGGGVGEALCGADAENPKPLLPEPLWLLELLSLLLIINFILKNYVSMQV